MRSLDRARDAIDLVATTVDAPGLVEHAIFGENLVDGRAPTRGVVFTEDIVKIAGQQGRYAVGHDRLVQVGEVIVERNVVEIKGHDPKSLSAFVERSDLLTLKKS